MIPDHTTIQVRSSGYGRAGIGRSSWKGLTRDATRRLRFVVHAADWLHSMVLHGRLSYGKYKQALTDPDDTHTWFVANSNQRTKTV